MLRILPRNLQTMLLIVKLDILPKSTNKECLVFQLIPGSIPTKQFVTQLFRHGISSNKLLHCTHNAWIYSANKLKVYFSVEIKNILPSFSIILVYVWIQSTFVFVMFSCDFLPSELQFTKSRAIKMIICCFSNRTCDIYYSIKLECSHNRFRPIIFSIHYESPGCL